MRYMRLDPCTTGARQKAIEVLLIIKQSDELEVDSADPPKQNPNTSEQSRHSSVREKCAIVCQRLAAIAVDLTQVIAVWDTLIK